ncbi:hypothetical protein LJC01_01985 [Clostridiaceae bacterium OttesenSCG-928-D20]|nr:hypothetical protein [Clostridiaceae bacterium OttesenSCG-928-D20]
MQLATDEKAKADPKQYLGSRSNEPIAIISESELYNVILLSRKPEAKSFKRLITHNESKCFQLRANDFNCKQVISIASK